MDVLTKGISVAYQQYLMFQRMYAQTQREDADKLLHQYEHEIRPLRDAAMKTCRQWTHSSCQELSDIHAMLQKYARLRYAVKHSTDGGEPEDVVPANDLVGYRHLERYRGSETFKFWYDLSRADGYYNGKHHARPYIGEMVEFSTFHWALHMTNNKCSETRGNEGGEPKTYALVLAMMEKIQPNVVRDHDIETFRSMTSHKFTLMQSEAIRALEDVNGRSFAR